MRFLLILMPILLTNAQNDIKDATDWVMGNLQPTVAKLGSRFLSPTNGAQTVSTTASCTTTTGGDGQCVNPLQCKSDPDPTDPTTKFIYRLGGCPSYQQCCPLNQILAQPKPPKQLPKVCGVSNPGGHRFRSTKTDFSDFADFPWMVALLTPTASTPWKVKEEYIGGGTLIHPSVVLTTAHKVGNLDPSQLKCRAGEWDYNSVDEILVHQERNVRRIVAHEEFLRAHSRNNAALLFLKSPFDTADVYHIGIACLGSSMPTPGTSCYSMGWGQSVHNDYESLLKKIKLPLVEDKVCERAYQRPDLLTASYRLHGSLTCAGGEDGIDTCYGDGGSSLVCSLPDYKSLKRYAVYGMVAYGMGCGLKDVPGVYAKVPAMLDWIDKQMDLENLPKDYKGF